MSRLTDSNDHRRDRVGQYILLSAGGGRVCFEVDNFTLTDKRK
jgi:hypothetical protein